jgi:hypothetical protein
MHTKGDVGSVDMEFIPPLTSDDQDKLKQFNLPISLFGKGYMWLPYVTLQQIDILIHEDTRGFLVGTSNSIFTQHSSCKLDVIVDVS